MTMADTTTARTTTLPFHKIGAICYALWGAWHLDVVRRIFEGAASIPDVGLQARSYQGGFHILFFCAAAMILAYWNWRNDRIAYWAQLFTIGWTEVGLFLFFMRPGIFPWLPTGWVGPVLWVLAVLFTTLSLREASRRNSL